MGEQMAKIGTAAGSSLGEQSLTLIKQAGVVVCASALIAVCARLILPLPFTPVPLSLANLGVLLVGLVLGSKRGFASAALYLVWGAAGLPVFSPVGPAGLAQLMGPTAGYLLAYPSVAFIAGWIAERGTFGFLRNIAAATVAELVLFASGIAWLAAVTHDWRRAAFLGLYPFFFAEVLKVMVAAGGASRLRRNF
jgi:biotin transport system substrate-specific component